MHEHDVLLLAPVVTSNVRSVSVLGCIVEPCVVLRLSGPMQLMYNDMVWALRLKAARSAVIVQKSPYPSLLSVSWWYPCTLAASAASTGQDSASSVSGDSARGAHGPRHWSDEQDHRAHCYDTRCIDHHPLHPEAASTVRPCMVRLRQ